MYDGKSLVYASSHMNEYTCNDFFPRDHGYEYDTNNVRYKNLKKSEEYQGSHEDYFYHKMDFNFYKQKPSLCVPPRLSGKM